MGMAPSMKVSDSDADGIADCVDTEECDGLDNDGDGYVDEGLTDDDDGDGYSFCDGDCDDSDGDTYPGATETVPGVDNDCDGVVGNTLPVAVPELLTLGTLYTCDTFQLDASSSYDLDGDPIYDYQWTLDSAPADSFSDDGDIDSATDISPWFVGDDEGHVHIWIGGWRRFGRFGVGDLDVAVVSRGWNTDPVADAGSDSGYSESVSCSFSGYTYVCDTCSTVVFALDGSGSSDDDGDTLRYSWSTSSSHATISDPSAPTTSMTISGIETEYGSVTTETITIELGCGGLRRELGH